MHPLTVLEECEESLCAHCHTVSLLGASVHLRACFALLAGWLSASEVDKAGPPMTRRGYTPHLASTGLKTGFGNGSVDFLDIWSLFGHVGKVHCLEDWEWQVVQLFFYCFLQYWVTLQHFIEDLRMQCKYNSTQRWGSKAFGTIHLFITRNRRICFWILHCRFGIYTLCMPSIAWVQQRCWRQSQHAPSHHSAASAPSTYTWASSQMYCADLLVHWGGLWWIASLPARFLLSLHWRRLGGSPSRPTLRSKCSRTVPL